MLIYPIGGYFLEFELNNLSTEQIRNLNDQINLLRPLYKTDRLCDELDDVIKTKTISLKTFCRLSKWCNTSGRYADAKPISIKISNILFNETLPLISGNKFQKLKIDMS